MEAAARQIKRLSFELGGNAPFIVFEDADFKAALDGAVAMKFLRVAGQSCICANRIYVQRSIADRFVPAFVDAVKGLKVGSGFEPAAQVGPLLTEGTRAPPCANCVVVLATAGWPCASCTSSSWPTIPPATPTRSRAGGSRNPVSGAREATSGSMSTPR